VKNLNKLYARIMAAATVGRADVLLPWRFFLTFRDTTGLAGIGRRETVATLSGTELAAVLGALPASVLDPDPDDAAALGRVMRLLRGLDDPASRAGSQLPVISLAFAGDRDLGHDIREAVWNGRTSRVLSGGGKHVATLTVFTTGDRT
jgi:hypothetical protein